MHGFRRRQALPHLLFRPLKRDDFEIDIRALDCNTVKGGRHPGVFRLAWPVLQKQARTSISFLAGSSKSSDQSAQDRVNTDYVIGILNAVEPLLQLQIPPHKKLSLFLRAILLNRTVLHITAFPHEVTANVPEGALLKTIEVAVAALRDWESGGERAFKVADGRWKYLYPQRQKQMLEERRTAMDAGHRLSLVSAYLRLTAGDVARNLDQAFGQYGSAIQSLESLQKPMFSLLAAATRVALGKAYLDYPTERHQEYSARAVEVLKRASNTLSRFDSDPALREALEKQAGASLVRRCLLIGQLVWASITSQVRGEPNKAFMGIFEPLFRAWLHWQLAIAYRREHNSDGAIQNCDVAIKALGEKAWEEQQFPSLIAAIEIEKGQALLSAASSGDIVEALHDATLCFSTVQTKSMKDDKVIQPLWKAFAQALVGDVQCFEALNAAGAVSNDNFDKAFDLRCMKLRNAAHFARLAGAFQLCHQSLSLLGESFARRRDYAKAYYALAAAGRVADRLHTKARTLRMSRYFTGLGARHNELLVRMSLRVAEGIAKPSDQKRILRRALCYADKGKTHLLQVQLANLQDAPCEDQGPPELIRLGTLRRSLHECELRVIGLESSAYVDERVLGTLKDRRRLLESRYLDTLRAIRERLGDTTYDPDKTIASLRPNDVERIASYLSTRKMALVEYYFSQGDLGAFVLLPSDVSWTRIKIERSELSSIAERWVGGYESVGRGELSIEQWARGSLTQSIRRLAPVVEAPFSIIEKWETERNVRLRGVMIIPHKFLHRLPLHAVPLPAGGPCGHKYAIRYVPSLSLFYRLIDASSDEEGRIFGGKAVIVSYRPRLEKHAGVPNSDMIFNLHEAREIATQTGGELLSGDSATPERVVKSVKGATYLHFACHGRFVGESPLDSALVLADAGRNESSADQSTAAPGEARTDQTERSSAGELTLARILRDIRLPSQPVVVMSACESGITRLEQSHEEHIGLTAGFLYAGARAVLASLWRVPDTASWLVMRATVEGLRKGADLAFALRAAQRQVREMSTADIAQKIRGAASQESDPSWRGAMLNEGNNICRGLQPSDRPFKEPYYWAGFTVNGL